MIRTIDKAQSKRIVWALDGFDIYLPLDPSLRNHGFMIKYPKLIIEETAG